tara:strand:- start:273 stop:1532 length:1260 start_codon:yes stop_codon:yes gene_type:complete
MDNLDTNWWNGIDEKLSEVEQQIDSCDLLKMVDDIDFDSLSDTSIAHTDSITVSKKDPHKDYVQPTPLRISTMTAVCNLLPKNCDLSEVVDTIDIKNQLSIDLELFAKNVEIDEIEGPIKSIQYGDLPIRGYNKNKKKKKVKKRNNFFNQATILVKLNSVLPDCKEERSVNVKVFLNGGIQMTGLKSEEEGIMCVERIIIPTLLNLKVKKQDGTIDKVVKKYDEIDYHNFRIVLINSDFKLGFKLKRDILYHILKTKYDIFATYEPCIYPGVNSKYYWNRQYKNELTNKGDSKYKCEWTDCELKEGVCYCSKMCSGKGVGDGDGKCKKVTISIFQSGSVIITGARSIEQIEDAYTFINNIFMTEFEHIRKKKLKLLHLLNKKNTKKTIIYIKKSKIKQRKQKTKTKKESKIIIKKSQIE